MLVKVVSTVGSTIIPVQLPKKIVNELKSNVEVSVCVRLREGEREKKRAINVLDQCDDLTII